MLTKIFKKNTDQKEGSHPALIRLAQFGTRSALCTVVRTADGREAREEVGPVSFYCRQNRLFTRGCALYLAPPQGRSSDDIPFAGRGEVLNLRFYHERIPYSLDCRVVQRVRFSDRLLERLEPRMPVGYRLAPMGNLKKNESRGSLRFAHIRGVNGPQVFPHFRFDLFVERVQFNGLAHEQSPEVIPFPGDDPVPEEVHACDSPEDLVAFFHHTIKANPEHLKEVHMAKVLRETRSTATELLDLGATSVLGLKGDPKGAQIHLRCPQSARQRDRKASGRLKEGDVVILHFVGRSLWKGGDVHYRWACRVSKCGLETLTLRSCGVIQKQTGLSVVVRDFSVGGVGLQNSPILETYLLGEGAIPEDPKALLARLEGTGLLLHFYPRLYFPNDVASYCPRIPAGFSVLGKVVRGHIDTGKDEGRIADLGVAFCHDPVDYDPQTLDVTAWEPLRGLRENRHFKEIHRALNSLLAYLER